MKNLSNIVKNIDAYPKTLEDFTIKTFSGAIVTIISTIFMVILFVIEFRDFLTIHVAEELFVDTSRTPTMKINFDVTFPRISCQFLSVDVIDSSGEHQFGVEHNVYKRRLDLQGNPLQEAELDTINKNHNKTTTAPEVTPSSTTEKVCKSCYGAREGCCNTCAEVREAYRQKNWAFQGENFEQCFGEKNTVKDGAAFQEGCQLYGYLEVNRVSGSFHIAPGKSYSINHVHVHDVQPYSSEDFNVTHQISQLSFGPPIEGKKNPLDGFISTADKGSMMFQYYIKVVPAWYVQLDGSQYSSNQFSVVSPLTGDNGVPGVFFPYELSPLMVRYTENQRSVGHFATDVCTIIGGIFTVAGLIDALLYRSSRLLQEKLQLGKAT